VHLGQIAVEQPGKAAVIMAGPGQNITFAELDAAANRVAHVLYDAGLRAGGHLAFRLPRRPAAASTGKLLKRVLRDE